MSIASSGIQPADSKLSVNERPSRIIGRIDSLRRRRSRFVIDSDAISHDSTSVMPPASNVANERVACATDNCTARLPASGIFNINALIYSFPLGVRDHKYNNTEPAITSGPNQSTLLDIQRESPTTICVTVGSSFPNPVNRSDIRGTT